MGVSGTVWVVLLWDEIFKTASRTKGKDVLSLFHSGGNSGWETLSKVNS